MRSIIGKAFVSLCVLVATFVTPAQSQADQSISLVSQNMNRFFDDKNDGHNEKIVPRWNYQRRLDRLSRKIISTFKKPDIVALQEVENLDILNDLARQVKRQEKDLDYQGILLEGNDQSGINIGFLVSSSYQVKRKTQLFSHLKLSNTKEFLFSRPPLLIEVCQQICITVVNLHLRSMRDINSSKHGNHTALKRKQQAETLASWVNQFQLKNPHRLLLLIGDFNAVAAADPFVDVLGTIIGNPDQVNPKWKSKDLINRDLINVTLQIPETLRYSYIYRKNRQQLDYLLISDSNNYSVNSVEFSYIDYKLSDHAALISEILAR